MGSKRVRGLLLVLLAALTLGVASAGGHTLVTTTVTVEVIGKGTVTSNPSGIKCGNGKHTCYIAFSGTGSNIDLTANSGNNWSFDSWGGPSSDTDVCGPSNGCSIPRDGADHQVTANFNGPSTTTSSLSVTYDNTSGDGSLTGGE